jgi:hypothetical protein
VIGDEGDCQSWSVERLPEMWQGMAGYGPVGNSNSMRSTGILLAKVDSTGEWITRLDHHAYSVRNETAVT